MRLTSSLFRCSVIFFDLANYFDKYLEFEMFSDKIKQEPVPDSFSCWASFEDHRLSMELNVFFGCASLLVLDGFEQHYEAFSTFF